MTESASVESGSRFLTAEWRYLGMLNYETDPAVVEPLVPRGCELDTFEGRVFVSVVGFQFLRTRVLGIPFPFHLNFVEVNLRFYVRRRAEGEWRRGVVFVKELVPRRAIAWVARTVYHENYVALPMRYTVPPSPPWSGTGSVRYEWREGSSWQGLSLSIAGDPVVPAEDAEESFITEHYWGYATQPDGSTAEYRVEHPRWGVWRATTAALDCDVAALYGDRFLEPLSSPPTSAFVADGSAVIVRRGRRLG